MPATLSRYRRRALVVATSSVNSMVLPVLGVLISLLVIRLASAELWGSFVQVLVVVQFAVHVVAWGNKDHLLRAFSLNPARIGATWRSSLSTRAVLVLAFSPVPLLLGWPGRLTLLVGVWMLGLVITQATEVVVVYRRAFGFALVVELVASAFLVGGVVALAPALHLEGLVLLFAIASLGRTGAFLLRFRRLILVDADGRGRLRGRPDPDHLRLAFPFFLLGFTGMLQSRIDLYTVSFLLPVGEVARYQVLINLLIYVQATANFLVLPFARNLYRMPHAAILRVSRRLFLAGLPLVLLAVAGIFLVLTYVYRFQVAWPLLLLGALYAWPMYYALPIIYSLYRSNAQAAVLKVNIAGAGLNLILNLYLVPRIGIAGALLATTTVQWLAFAAYVALGRALRDRHALAVS
jgi:O-antigen/teichoic acid export membrane protein